MTDFEAVMLIEDGDADETTTLQAWAQLIKSGACWHLQGWYGRAAYTLIDGGYITSDGDITDAS